MFSSASALLSSPRLGSYAAANAFLDGLAHYRHAHNQPALSVNWGVWADEGMAAQFNRDDVAMLALRGMGTLSTRQGLEALQNLMQQAAAQHATQVGVLPVNWRRWQELYPAFVDAPFLTHVVQRPKQTAAPRPPGLTRDRLLAAGLDEQPTLLQTYLNSLAAKTMGVSNLDSRQPLNELGLDSLMAVEMKNRIETDLGVVVPMVKLLQGPSIAQLAAHVLAQVAALEPATAPKPTSAAKTEDQPAAQQLLAQLDQLSDDQVDALLTDLLIAEGQPDE
jgi:acyl carrier protein